MVIRKKVLQHQEVGKSRVPLTALNSSHTEETQNEPPPIPRNIGGGQENGRE